MKRDSRHTLLFILADPVIKEHCLSLKKCHINYNIEFLNNEEFHFKDFYAGNTFVLCDKDDSIEKAVKSIVDIFCLRKIRYALLSQSSICALQSIALDMASPRIKTPRF